jgi:hypothetical protein
MAFCLTLEQQKALASLYLKRNQLRSVANGPRSPHQANPGSSTSRTSRQVHPYLRTSDTSNEYLSVFCQARLYYPDKFFTYLRMQPSTFERLLDLVGPSITKQTTNFGEPHPPDYRLALTLRVLTHGDKFADIAVRYLKKTYTYRFLFQSSTASNRYSMFKVQVWG